MAVPARRVSKARRDKRRQNESKVAVPAIVKCKNCGDFMRAHRVCPVCGYYNGRQVITVEEN